MPLMVTCPKEAVKMDTGWPGLIGPVYAYAKWRNIGLEIGQSIELRLVSVSPYPNPIRRCSQA